MFERFVFTKRHYTTIMNQATDNFPHESGGFLGGYDGYILGILPTHNLETRKRETQFVITHDDIQRAHAFFRSHRMLFIALYHSHPNGAPYPSTEDINTGHRFHFIVAKVPNQSPIMNAWHIVNRTPKPIPIVIYPDDQFVTELPDAIKKKWGKATFQSDPMLDGAAHLEQIKQSWQREQRPIYPRLDPISPGSDFSTLACPFDAG